MRNLFFLLVLSFVLGACKETVTELKENIFSAQDNASIENEINSTIEATIDWAGDNVFYKKKSERIIPQNIKVTFIDSTFKDLDGVEGILDFGVYGSYKPFGLLCSDGKYRSGKVHFTLNKPLEMEGAVFMLKFDEKDSFYSGSGTEMLRIIGSLSAQNEDGKSIRIKTDNLMYHHHNTKLSWTCDRTIKIIKENGPGIWGDIYSMEGTAKGTNRSGEEFEVNIIEPLIKKMESGCSKTFVQGKLEIVSEKNNKTIHVDYDPSGKAVCDQILEAEINGKKTVFILE